MICWGGGSPRSCGSPTSSLKTLSGDSRGTEGPLSGAWRLSREGGGWVGTAREPESVVWVPGELGAPLCSQKVAPLSSGGLEGPTRPGSVGAEVEISVVVASSHSWTKLRMPWATLRILAPTPATFSSLVSGLAAGAPGVVALMGAPGALLWVAF